MYVCVQTAAKLVDEARDATEFLRSHIVQAKINSQGNYGVCFYNYILATINTLVSLCTYGCTRTTSVPIQLRSRPMPLCSYHAALKVNGDFREDAKMTLHTPAEASSKPKEGCCGGGC